MEPNVLEAFGRYLALHGEDPLGRAFFDAHAADAAFPIRFDVFAGLTWERFEELTRPQEGETGPVARVAFAPPTLRSWTPEGEDRGVAWFDSHVGDRPVLLVAGLVKEAGTWKIGWAKVAAEPADWSYALGKAQTMGEFALGMTSPPDRGWLDISYHRIHDLFRPPLLTLDGARFSCHSHTTCCKVEYTIPVTSAAQAVIDALPWEEIHPPLKGVKLPETDNGNLLLKALDEKCRFLDEHNHCRIHKALGRQPFPACAAFPFHFALTPEGLATAGSFVCGSVRGGLGAPLADRAADLYERAAMSHRLLPESFLLGEDKEIPWETYRDVEQELLAILGRTDLPLWRRLWVGTRILDARMEDRDTYNEAWEREELEPLGDDRREGLQALLLPRLLNYERVFFDEFRNMGYPPVFHEPLAESERLAGYFQNLLFSKKVSYHPYSLTTGFNVSIMVYLQALHVLEMSGRPTLDPDFWTEIALQSFHGLLFRVLAPNLTKSPGFGRWLLRYPERARVAVTG